MDIAEGRREGVRQVMIETKSDKVVVEGGSRPELGDVK